MKLLIDIPDQMYLNAKADILCGGDILVKAIKNGTPARCMNEAEKERLIKKDLVSIENRVRHAFNQGYEMGLKGGVNNE